MKFVFVQCYSLGDVTGGSKILRSVAENAPVSVASICTGFGRTHPLGWPGEIAVPLRPGLGRLDRSRLAWMGSFVEAAYSSRFAAQLEKKLIRLQATDVHLVPHGWGDFVGGYRAAKRLGLRVHVSIHDDFAHTAVRHPMRKSMSAILGELWRNACTRFVISEAMGKEYSARYGLREHLVHTDGVKNHDDGWCYEPGLDAPIYFMGMFNNIYIPNFVAVTQALGDQDLYKRIGKRPSLMLRAYGIKLSDYPSNELIQILPTGSHEVVEAEIRGMKFLYLPLPFGSKATNLCKFSMSTKMVTYLSSGVPIIYHGPADSAAGTYLAKNRAAFQINSTDHEEIIKVLSEAYLTTARSVEISQNAMACARRDFDADDLKRRFWNAVLPHN